MPIQEKGGENMAQEVQPVRRGLPAAGLPTPALGIKSSGLKKVAEGVPQTWEDDGGAPEGGRFSTRMDVAHSGLPIHSMRMRGLVTRRAEPDDVPQTWEDDGGAPEGGRPSQWRK